MRDTTYSRRPSPIKQRVDKDTASLSCSFAATLIVLNREGADL